MKLTKTHNGYVCASDDRVRFSHGQDGWVCWLGNNFPPTFATLAEAEAFARPHWRPKFFLPVLERLDGDGLRLWDAAVMGDQQSFLLLLDWVEEHLPNCPGFTGRDSMLRQAEECGLFQVRCPDAGAGSKRPPVTARIEGGELVLSGLRCKRKAAQFAARSPRWRLPAEDTLRCELPAADYPAEARLPLVVTYDPSKEGIMLLVLRETWLWRLFRRGDAAGVRILRDYESFDQVCLAFTDCP